MSFIRRQAKLLLTMSKEAKEMEALKGILTSARSFTLASAMRGPDRQDVHNVKLLFTAPLRQELGISDSVASPPFYGLVVRNSSDHLSEEEATLAKREVIAWEQADKEGFNHYMSHICEAASCLELHGLANLASDLRNTPQDVEIERLMSV